MNTLLRWGKFNLVGAMGMGLQLALLALFNRWTAGHYLYASAAAIELTLLHNFVWHLHYTWRDRRASDTRLRQLARFHLSSGLVSMLGNLTLMRLLVHEARLPLLVSNVIAIICCSVANFRLGNKWAFAGPRNAEAACQPVPPAPISIHFLTLALLVFFVSDAMVHAQSRQMLESESAPTSSSQTSTLVPGQTPTSQPGSPSAYPSKPNDTYLYHVGAFCGIGASTSTAASKPATGCGAGMTLVPLPVFIEVGIMAPQANRSYLSGYISLDSSFPLMRSSSKYLPMAIVGYSRLFETGHALDYGLALALPRFSKHKDDSKSLRIELRDYWTFANPNQHNVVLRVGWMGEEAD
ncbi:GtrA family protein [Tunturiibacter gelidoferens]|uniref:Putative flippase GtrA n=1 Tax=Tunturiibacter lichenicola TaxID=2051959 RepID=A0A7Y9TCB1_9BACT|nr:GtrA family protein [Edaphobacter lichenicola]NYF53925.1 putative flippase GtrA [Edaphobacter lichenicola]